jgi:hypothetical protein
MIIKYQIIKQKEGETNHPIILHPPTIGDGIFEFDTIEECETKIEQIKGFSIYENIKLSVQEVYYN